MSRHVLRLEIISHASHSISKTITSHSTRCDVVTSKIAESLCALRIRTLDIQSYRPNAEFRTILYQNLLISGAPPRTPRKFLHFGITQEDGLPEKCQFDVVGSRAEPWPPEAGFRFLENLRKPIGCDFLNSWKL